MDTGFAAEILYKRQLWGSFYLAFSIWGRAKNKF